MCNLNELDEPDDADAAMAWAVQKEFEMRERRYRIAKEGLTGVMQRTAKAMQRFHEAFAGVADG